MDSATEDIYFQKINELIQDEDKIVTLPYLAKTLNISVQDSQHLLSKYIKDQRKLKPNELAATYIITGSLNDKGTCVVFVKENDLEQKRSLFNKIQSEVLFSIQKYKQIDFNILSLVDDVTSSCEKPLLGSILSKNCVKRVLKVKKLPPPPQNTVKGKSSFFMPKTQSSSSVEKIDTTIKQESKPSKQNGIAGMFTKAAASQAAKERDATEKKSTNSSNKPNKGGLSTFLSKGSSTSSVKSENGIGNSSSIGNQPSEIEEFMDVDFCEEIEENKDKKKDKEVKKSEKKEEKKQEKNKNKRHREKSEEKSTKKRKRIIQRNDSESDDMFENDEAEDIIEKSDEEPERVPSPVAKKPLAPKNKIRKAIDKTYVDEEGFIVTNTEYVYESAPEDDEEIKKEIEGTKPKLEKKTSASSENDVSPKKGAKNKKGKKNNTQNQPTLMNFFKKK